MSRWMVYAKKADFNAIGEKYNIDPVIARIIRNRDVCRDEDISRYVNADIDMMHNPADMKDADKAADILIEKIKNNKKIRIIGDYDIDGICSITILLKGLIAAGANVDYTVPDRIVDGYGINENLIDKALEDGVDTIITCDNGIAAIEQINYGKEKGLTIIVTDHHDIPFKEENGSKVYMSSQADAIVNPKQQECKYPYELLCGAGVAYKLITLLYGRLALDKSDLQEYIQLAAVATIGDIVELKDENRILVKHGLKTMKDTKNIGLRTLIQECGVEIEDISAYHIGFIIGPCLNASGRLDTAAKAVELLMETDSDKVREMAQMLRSFNEERKEMTEKQAKLAIEKVEAQAEQADNVLVVYLPDCHESIAGIIAGRVREHFYKPAIVITDAAEGAKGSGRSIEGYNMFEELTRCRELLTKFGGHPMAAGLSLEKENIDVLRKQLNDNAELTEEVLTPVTWIDVPMPLDYVSMRLISQLELLEPFGKGNEKPIFADRNLVVRAASVIGKNANVLKMQLQCADGSVKEAIQFRADKDDVPKRGEVLSVVYYPGVNDFKGKRTIQFIIQEWKRI
ncbi:MAG: single-stranded-DNA-specific exonuclease RecJ [Lachnospira sp.]|nr:single-stranded-DNA-specific exonuclease RecJ [Lachnospira sp.]